MGGRRRTSATSRASIAAKFVHEFVAPPAPESRYAITQRKGVAFDSDGFTIASGEIVRELGHVEAPNPYLARARAELVLSELGVLWEGYVNGPDWTCGWCADFGIVTLQLAVDSVGALS